MSETVVNDATAYGVRVEPAEVTAGQRYWRAIRVHHRTPAENQNRNQLVLDLRDQSGERVFGGRLRVTWDDQQEEPAVEQPSDEPGAVVPMQRDRTYAVEALGLPGESIPSDRVIGLHTNHPDEAPGNELFHHSFGIVFQRTIAEDGESTESRPPVSDEVEEGASSDDEESEAPVPEATTIARYILVGDPRRPQIRTVLIMLGPLLAQWDPGTVLGFQVDEARRAQSVLILAAEDDILPEVEASLRSNGRTVQRAVPRRWHELRSAVEAFLADS